MGTRVWNQARSIGMEPGPFHTLQKVWNRRPFRRYGTDHVPGVARIRKIRGLILHDRTIPVPYPFHTSESDFQRIPHPRVCYRGPRVWYRGPFHSMVPDVFPRALSGTRKKLTPFGEQSDSLWKMCSHELTPTAAKQLFILGTSENETNTTATA